VTDERATRVAARLQRIAIIGNAGGGKSTLARALGQFLAIPVHAIDDVQWKANWRPAPEAEVAAVHANWLTEPRWIIDGWGGWDLVRDRFRVADAIVVVDFPISIHYWWALKRQVAVALGHHTGWPPPGCRALPITLRLLRRMRDLHLNIRPQLLRLADEAALRDRVVILRSPAAMRDYRQRLTRSPDEQVGGVGDGGRS
jgi:ABC-type dipeptide/oligopeptide/nickel transport system ATPase component